MKPADKSDAIKAFERAAELLRSGRLDDLLDRNSTPARPDGYPTTASGAAGPTSGGIADPTGQAAELALAHRHDYIKRCALAALRDLSRAVAHAQGFAGNLSEGLRVATKPVTQPAGQGDCLACGRYVTGHPNDRLRSGYCPACYMTWTRRGRPDRTRFERTRRRELEQDSGR